MICIRVGVASLLLLATPALAEHIVGRASVIDGDTIEIHGQRIRLEGIDAPESRQTCTDKKTGAAVRCGQRAAFFLADMIEARVVSCEPKGRDRYKRVLAQCKAAGRDIAAAMVDAGWALAYVAYSREYELCEAAARKARAGMWAYEFIPPWDWRRRT
ncbi:thermonuclease family protein [Aquabacter sp. CN5-332]|uniref:thermonuclease family protein n=1 Tax=Aquabacter sp. CN5-332 TaxID=3156608 RepID=UPI0032B4E52A